MLSVSLLIVAAAVVYMVEAYIHTYYAIEYMHGTSLFFVLLAKYGTPVLFLLLCAYVAYRKIAKREKHRHQSKKSNRQTRKNSMRTESKQS